MYFLRDLDLGGIQNFKKLMHGDMRVRDGRVQIIGTETVFTVQHARWLCVLISLLPKGGGDSPLGHSLRDLDTTSSDWRKADAIMSIARGPDSMTGPPREDVAEHLQRRNRKRRQEFRAWKCHKRVVMTAELSSGAEFADE